MNDARRLRRVGLIVVVGMALVASAIAPFDWLTWFMETAPVLIGAPLLYLTARRFPLTGLLELLIAAHALVLILGAHYSYAEVPLGFWMQDAFGFQRNNYDRIGHFAQGFVPAILTREILLRRSPLVRGRWLFFLVTCVCLAFSAFYELIEWQASIWLGGGADDFLGTQGDRWDTQSDMALALVGALIAQWTLGRAHDRALARVTAD